MAAEPLANGEWFDFGPDTDAFLARVRSDGLLAAFRHSKRRSIYFRRAGFALGIGTIVPVLLGRSTATIVDVPIRNAFEALGVGSYVHTEISRWRSGGRETAIATQDAHGRRRRLHLRQSHSS